LAYWIKPFIATKAGAQAADAANANDGNAMAAAPAQFLPTLPFHFFDPIGSKK
jgi:hypothetical protein